MESFAVKRIQRELRNFIKNEDESDPCEIKVEVIDDSFLKLRGKIMGPPNTPYEGGVFELEFKIPSKYPFEPPAVSLDVLYLKWTPVTTLRVVLLSLRDLLSSPRTDQQQDHLLMTRQFRDKPRMYKLTARHWTHVYAGGPHRNKSFERKIRKMMAVLDASKIECRAVLSFINWDLDFAIRNFGAFLVHYTRSSNRANNHP